MGIFIDIGILAGGLEYLNATRMSVAAEGLTEANNKKRVHPVSVPSVPSIHPDGYFYWYRYLDGGEVTNYKLLIVGAVIGRPSCYDLDGAVGGGSKPPPYG